MASPGFQYWYQWRPTLRANDSRTVLCFDGRIVDDLELFPFDRLQDRGFLVIRSPGGDQSVAITVANILRQKNVTVIVRDFCLSACANAILIASDNAHVLENAVVAWNGGLSGCRGSEVKVSLARKGLPCHDIGSVRDFFKARDIGDRHTILPQTFHTKSRFDIVLRSAANKQSVSWMWHPDNHGSYFKDRIAYEAFPEHQEAVDAMIGRFGLHVRVVYDAKD